MGRMWRFVCFSLFIIFSFPCSEGACLVTYRGQPMKATSRKNKQKNEKNKTRKMDEKSRYNTEHEAFKYFQMVEEKEEHDVWKAKCKCYCGVTRELIAGT